MEKFIIIALIAFTAILFWSPWMGEEGSEDIIRSMSQEQAVRAEIIRLSDQYGSWSETNPEGCDGFKSSWIPFGRKIQYCGHGDWYITFWGYRF